MNPPPPSMRCGIDTVEISRIERLLEDLDEEGLREFFTAVELEDAGAGPGRAASLAARFAAKEACCKLFPRETCLGTLEPARFGVVRDGHGKPRIEPDPAGRAVMDRHFIRDIEISLTHSGPVATAVALAAPEEPRPPWYGRLLHRILPVKRHIVTENIDRVFGDTLAPRLRLRLAQNVYAHFAKCLVEFLAMPFLTRKRKEALVRIEGSPHVEKSLELGKGVLLLTGHFGNWEVSTIAGIAKVTAYRGRFHFIRRPLKPKWFNDFVIRRFRKAGFGTVEKKGTLDDILRLLDDNQIVVAVFDQCGSQRHAVVSEFFGHPARTFKSLAVLAKCTGAPVVPASSWREPGGGHVLRFHPPLEIVTEGPTREIVARNTRLFNETLERIILRHPEQWIWMHRRWKPPRQD